MKPYLNLSSITRVQFQRQKKKVKLPLQFWKNANKTKRARSPTVQSYTVRCLNFYIKHLLKMKSHGIGPVWKIKLSYPFVLLLKVVVFTHPVVHRWCSPWRRLVLQTEISGNFLFHTFFCFTYFVFCVFVSLTAVRVSRSLYFFTSNVLLIQVYLRSGNSQRLVAVVFPVYKLCISPRQKQLCCLGTVFSTWLLTGV